MSTHQALEQISAPNAVDAAHEGARARMAQEALSSPRTQLSENINSDKQKNPNVQLPALEIHDSNKPASDSTLNPRVTPAPGTPVELKATNPEVAPPPGVPVEAKPQNQPTEKTPNNTETPTNQNIQRQPNMMSASRA